MSTTQTGEADDLGNQDDGTQAAPPAASETNPQPQGNPPQPSDVEPNAATEATDAGDPQDTAEADPLDKAFDKIEAGSKPTTPKPDQAAAAPEPVETPAPETVPERTTKVQSETDDPNADLPRLPDETWKKMPREVQHAFSKARQITRTARKEAAELRAKVPLMNAAQAFDAGLQEMGIPGDEAADLLVAYHAATRKKDASAAEYLRTKLGASPQPPQPQPIKSQALDALLTLADETGFGDEVAKVRAELGLTARAATPAQKTEQAPPPPATTPAVDTQEKTKRAISAFFQGRAAELPTDEAGRSRYQQALSRELDRLSGGPGLWQITGLDRPPHEAVKLVAEAHQAITKPRTTPATAPRAALPPSARNPLRSGNASVSGARATRNVDPLDAALSKF